MTRATFVNVKEKHNNYPMLPTTSITFLNTVAGKQVSLSLEGQYSGNAGRYNPQHWADQHCKTVRLLLSAGKILSTAAYPRGSFITEFLAGLFEFVDRSHQPFKGAFKVFAEVKPVSIFDV